MLVLNFFDLVHADGGAIVTLDFKPEFSVSPLVMDIRCAQRGERGTEAEVTVSNPQKRWVYVLMSQAFFLEDHLLALFVDN